MASGLLRRALHAVARLGRVPARVVGIPARLAAATRAIGARGGRGRALVATLAGAIGAVAMPPFAFWPALILSFGLFVLLLDGACRSTPLKARLRPAAGTGWFFGFGYFLASLWWIGAAFLVDAAAFGWLLPFAVVAMPAGLALFSAFGAAVAALFWQPGGQRLFAFAAALTLAEWLRGNVLTGFPWNSFGYAFSQSPALMQSAALVGLWGLTFFALLSLSAPVLLLEPGRGGWRRWVGPGLAMGLIVLAAGWGLARLRDTPLTMVPGVHLRIMQPSLPQDQKFKYVRSREILRDYLALSALPTARAPQGLKDVTVLIWPESAFPFVYEREAWAGEMIAAALPDNVSLVTGAVRYGPPPPGQFSHFFNAIRVIDHNGRVRMNADKVHLVPFGEYLPFQNALEAMGLRQLTQVRGGFAAGTALGPLHVPGLPLAAPLVCYEVIFPDAVMPTGPQRPELMLNLTNDAWFGDTPGPYQHFAQARMRAVEEGMPLVRAANSGISAIIGPMGQIVVYAPLDVRTVVDGPLPAPLKSRPFAAGHANVIAFSLLISGFLLAIWPFRRRNTRKS
ncbi:apolipoprotein N-acyltransferase [Xanthobacter sp. TB0139]|uniref:apolipoprotein N-acyltransferase n=1 Tax=Xanthobacter sp. TB0139 TaxID=3459178 RepID=UPI0040397C0D